MSVSALIPTKSKFKFTGGVHLLEHKSQSMNSDLQSCTLPEKLVLPLNMHSGTDAIPTVVIGDQVSQGQVIAEAAEGISAFIHSPVAGKVVELSLMPVANQSGIDEMCLQIAPDQQLTLAYDRTSKLSNTPEQWLETIRQSGIVGLGGAGFPSHFKLSSSSNNCHTLLLNGAECEPYISCDDRAMRDFSDEIIQGAVIVAKILNCQQIQIAIEDNKKTAIAAMLEAANHYQTNVDPSITAAQTAESASTHSVNIEVIEIPTIFPSGGERQLLEIISGNQVPSGSFPASIGYTVQNIGTALAVYEAVVLNKPLIDRIVTVTGAAVSRPGNYRVAIGTPIRHLLDFAGWDETQCHQLIHGGPMMGFPLLDPDRPISKVTNCIIAATLEEFPEPPPERSCIRCGQCADVCPASLLPQQLFWFSQSGEFHKAEEHRLMDCIECGACAYVCPSQIPLVDYYRFAKGELRKRTAIEIKAERSKKRFEVRNLRFEQQTLEKLRLRQERKRIRAENLLKNDGVDPNKQAVADALARTQAKKMAQKENRLSTSRHIEGKSDAE